MSPALVGVGVLIVAVLASCSSSAPTPVGFYRARAVPGDRATVVVMADSCKSTPYQVTVKESATVVSIKLVGMVTPGPPSPACSDLIQVHLNAPLIARQVLDATTGRAVPVQ